MGKFKDLTGKKFGRLTVIERNGHKGRVISWLCKCDCGNEITISVSNLTSGNTKSCGCYRSELAEKLNISYKKLQKNQDKITYIQNWLKDNFEVKDV